jgi:AAHS family 4-hydroxybenzoate transporter-like MFS transporter
MARRPEYWPRLAQFLTRMGHTLPPHPQFEDRIESGSIQSASPKALFTLEFARETVGLWIAFFFCIGGIYLVFGWLPAMLASQGLDLAKASSGLAIYNFGGVLGILIWSVLIPFFGSRKPLLFGSIACAASALALMFVPIEAHSLSRILGVGLCIHGLLANAVQTSMYALAAHVYPTSIRATGIAYSAAIGRTGGLLSSVFGSYIIQTGANGYWMALAIVMMCATLGLVWVRKHYPAARTTAG